MLTGGRKKYMREYQLNWIRARRDKWLADNGPCVDCGSNINLEVDHVDPSMKVDHKVWSWSEDRRVGELDKCEVRCRECHKKKTKRERTLPAEHGQMRMYSRGCRCSKCKHARGLYARMEMKKDLPWVKKRKYKEECLLVRDTGLNPVAD